VAGWWTSKPEAECGQGSLRRKRNVWGEEVHCGTKFPGDLGAEIFGATVIGARVLARLERGGEEIGSFQKGLPCLGGSSSATSRAA